MNILSGKRANMSGEWQADSVIRKFRITTAGGNQNSESEFEKFRIVQDRLYESDFDKMVKQVGKGEK